MCRVAPWREVALIRVTTRCAGGQWSERALLQIAADGIAAKVYASGVSDGPGGTSLGIVGQALAILHSQWKGSGKRQQHVSTVGA